MHPLSVVFMGTPEIASDSMKSILELRRANMIDLRAVYTKPPVWNNKKKDFVISPVSKLALEHDIDVRTPRTFRDNKDEADFLKSLNIDLIILVAFGLILPQEILNIPKYGILNLHPSLLPDLRGPAPIHCAILKRIRFSGVSVMALDAGVDTGPIAAQQKIDAGKDEYYRSLYKRLSLAGAVLLAEVVKTVFKFKLNMRECAFSQSSIDPDPFFTLSGLINTDEQKVDFFTDDPLEIYAKVRAFEENGGAFFIFKSRAVKLIEARLFADKTELGEDCSSEQEGKDGLFFDYCDYADLDCGLKSLGNDETEKADGKTDKRIPYIFNIPGIIVSANKSGLIISTIKKGVYMQILKVKPEGKNVMGHADFINGYRIKQGDECR